MTKIIKTVIYSKFGSEKQKESHMKSLEEALNRWGVIVRVTHARNDVRYDVYEDCKAEDQDILKKYYKYCIENGIEKGSVKHFAKEHGILLE